MPSLLPDLLDPVHTLRVMGRLVRRRVTRPGASPGTLVHAGPPQVESVRIDLMAYGPEGCREAQLSEVGEGFPFPPGPGVSWLNIEGLHEVEIVREVGERLAIHPLILEDIVNTWQRPKIEEHADYLYIVLPMLSVDPDSGTIRDEQLSLILGPDYVVTFQERHGDSFDAVRERIRSEGARIRGYGADFLAYALVDSVVDHYFTVLETVGDATERVELEVMQNPTRDTMHRLHGLKREMLVLRRAVWPVRDMVNALLRSESALIDPQTRVFVKDVYDHTVRVIDTVEILRDVVGGMIDLYLSSISHRANEVMKTLTVMASIFIPLTFIAGVYGMNFAYMPELEQPWAYPTLLGLMGAIVVGMLWHFKRKGWI